MTAVEAMKQGAARVQELQALIKDCAAEADALEAKARELRHKRIEAKKELEGLLTVLQSHRAQHAVETARQDAEQAKQAALKAQQDVEQVLARLAAREAELDAKIAAQDARLGDLQAIKKEE